MNSIIFTTKVNTLCGIVGIWLKNESALVQREQLETSIQAIQHRGPNVQKIKIDANVGLAHARLSILDLSSQAHQPMTDDTGRYSLIFNGEIYNYKALINNLPSHLNFKTSSDTEVLLQYLIHFGMSRLNDLNGFFSFVFYDHHTKEIHFARDRFGIKPLMIYEDQNQVIFSSELSPILSFDVDKTINHEALDLLFQLTYIPAPHAILKHVSVLEPGCYGRLKKGSLTLNTYYNLCESAPVNLSYDEAIEEVRLRVKRAVKRRLVSDVPLGTFLSGGVDSSIISLVAKEFKKDLKTFSVGFDVPFFDESEYATEMAKSIGSDHHQIQLNRSDFKDKFQSFLTLNHQPFTDSSAFAVYLLSEKTKEHVTVCLSGDGADELFGGYRKYEAEFGIRNASGFKRAGVKCIARLTRSLPKGRHGKWPELNRKIQKMARGLSLSLSERYWEWLTFIEQTDKNKLLKIDTTFSKPTFNVSADLNSVFKSDQLFVLPNDMLTKVDRMSMTHALEVRTPFLDHELVDFVNSLPANYKVNKKGRKQVLIDAFKDQLPERIYNRTKKGFEIPIFDWLKTEMQDIFESEIFSESYINNQELFNYEYICELKQNFKNNQFGDKVYLLWTLIIFQNWWHRNLWKQKDRSKS